MSETKWWVYMVETSDGKLYTGITTDVERRFEEHKSGKKGAKFFRSSDALGIVYREECLNRSEASKREAAIKKLSRQKKLELVSLFNR